MENAVLNQFGMHLDEASLRELATGPVIQRIREVLDEEDTMLHECTREMFLMAMLVRLGKISEQDITVIYSAFRRLDAGHDGRLDSRDIIFGELKKQSNHDSISHWRRAQRNRNIMSNLPYFPNIGESNQEESSSSTSDDYYIEEDEEDSYDSAPETYGTGGNSLRKEVDLESQSLKKSISVPSFSLMMNTQQI